MALVGFDMNIRGFLFDGLGEHGVDQADDRRVVLAVEQIVGVRQLFGEGIEVELIADVGHHAVRLRRITLIAEHQHFLERVRRQTADAHRPVRQAARFQQRPGGGIGRHSASQRSPSLSSTRWCARAQAKGNSGRRSAAGVMGGLRD
ncbi:Uncharacterised protein [Klebsiella pneumoniae subsp. pneumoniae]|uniref:Uncharacterized protein n=1 Tax=Klebsiella pneumoniae subsp. pneumoniae TaxID=72407 RepID=A0A378ACS0_KLEPN|nr:Uncharacterised protein [Klebsiella pneumoniae subsp. pneumoniae]